VLREALGGTVDAIIMASGSEVHLALAAADELEHHGTGVRVVSMPSWELFAAQDDAWQEQVLPRAVRTRVAVEAAATFGWERWTGSDGDVVGIDRFGVSAPAADAARELGMTVDAVVASVHRCLARIHGAE
jgi:transketolase